MNPELEKELQANRIFSYSNDPFIEVLKTNLYSYSPKAEIVVIESNSSKIECKFVDNKSYIIWDESYWFYYYRYMALMSCPDTYDNCNNDRFINIFIPKKLHYHEQLIWLSSIFTSMLSKKYDEYISLSETLYFDMYSNMFDLFEALFCQEEINGQHDKLVVPFEISKLLALYHEIFHVLYNKDEIWGKQQNLIVKQIIEDVVLDTINNAKKLYSRKERKRLIKYALDIIKDKKIDELNELTADYFSYITVLSICKQLKISKSNFINTFLIYMQFNWQTNLVFEYWNTFYFNIITKKFQYENAVDIESKKGYFIKDYKDQLSFPYIERKNITISKDTLNRLKKLDLTYQFRFGIFNFILVNITDFKSINLEYTENYSIKMNNFISKQFAENLRITMLNNEYVSSRIIKSIRNVNKKVSRDNEALFYGNIKNWKFRNL